MCNSRIHYLLELEKETDERPRYMGSGEHSGIEDDEGGRFGIHVQNKLVRT
jgi:hypothetical protein